MGVIKPLLVRLCNTGCLNAFYINIRQQLPFLHYNKSIIIVASTIVRMADTTTFRSAIFDNFN